MPSKHAFPFPMRDKGGMWDLIVFFPDHCLSFFTLNGFTVIANVFARYGFRQK